MILINCECLCFRHKHFAFKIQLNLLKIAWQQRLTLQLFSLYLAGQLHESERKINWPLFRQQLFFGFLRQYILMPYLYQWWVFVLDHWQLHPQLGHRQFEDFMNYGEGDQILAHCKFPCSLKLVAHLFLLINFSKCIRWQARWGRVYGSNRYFCQTLWRICRLQWCRRQGLWSWFHLKNYQQEDVLLH